MGIRQLKQQSRRDQLKIRRLQAQVNHSGAKPLARSGTQRELSLQSELKTCELERAMFHQQSRLAQEALQKITTMSRAKEARETAGAALAKIGVSR